MSLTNTGKWIVTIGCVAAVASAAAMLLSGPGYRLDLWHFRTGFTIVRWAFWVAAAGAVLSLLGLILARGRPGKTLVAALAGIAVGAAAAYVPWSLKQTVDALPLIHDITTDVDNPPQFVAVAKLRKEGDDPVAYDGPEVAAQQRKAYPDLVPEVVAADRDAVFKAAEAAVRAMKLDLVEASIAEGRIEATHTSFFYGFTDDMVIRVVADGAGARLDVRSKSRVGRSDVGQNARRIRLFLEKFRASLGA
jgi:uncharacterized protein (DUF1499 family)